MVCQMHTQRILAHRPIYVVCSYISIYYASIFKLSFCFILKDTLYVCWRFILTIPLYLFWVIYAQVIKIFVLIVVST